MPKLRCKWTLPMERSEPSQWETGSSAPAPLLRVMTSGTVLQASVSPDGLSSGHLPLVSSLGLLPTRAPATVSGPPLCSRASCSPQVYRFPCLRSYNYVHILLSLRDNFKTVEKSEDSFVPVPKPKPCWLWFSVLFHSQSLSNALHCHS